MYDRRQWKGVTLSARLRKRHREETAAIETGDTLKVVREIPRRQVMLASVNEHGKLEIDVLERPQPVKASDYRRDVLVPIKKTDVSVWREHRVSTAAEM